jgi:hypothetical protein
LCRFNNGLSSLRILLCGGVEAFLRPVQGKRDAALYRQTAWEGGPAHLYESARDRSGNTADFPGGKVEELERIARSPHGGDAPGP